MLPLSGLMLWKICARLDGSAESQTSRVSDNGGRNIFYKSTVPRIINTVPGLHQPSPKLNVTTTSKDSPPIPNVGDEEEVVEASSSTESEKLCQNGS